MKVAQADMLWNRSEVTSGKRLLGIDIVYVSMVTPNQLKKNCSGESDVGVTFCGCLYFVRVLFRHVFQSFLISYVS